MFRINNVGFLLLHFLFFFLILILRKFLNKFSLKDEHNAIQSIQRLALFNLEKATGENALLLSLPLQHKGIAQHSFS